MSLVCANTEQCFLGCAAVSYDANGCVGSDQKVHERAHTYSSEEGRTDSGGYQAILH